MKNKPLTHSPHSWTAFLAGVMISGAVCAEQLFNAHYEISVREGSETGTIKSVFRLKPGEISKMELLPNNIQLSVQSVSAREYDLRIVITPKKGVSAPARFDKTFRGQFGVPLELDAEAGTLQVKGAFGIASL